MVSYMLLFVKWYLIEMPLRIIQGYALYACALLDIVPFGFLLKTLLSPWKNILDRTPRRGLNPQLLFEAFCFSLLARGVGCVVRIITIAFGLVLHALLLGLTVLYLVLWIAFPLLTVWGVFLIALSI
ncbi:MAG: hypothetical protein WC840_00005 [Candidatus Peribacteraceae bacterium]